MTIFAKVTSKGQTTIPAELRAKLGVGAGDRLRYDELPDGRIVVGKADDSFESLRGIVKLGRPVSVDDIIDAIDEARGAMGRPDVERP